MRPIEHGVALQGDEIMVYQMAYDTVRTSQNQENLPEVFRQRQLRLPEPDHQGDVILDRDMCYTARVTAEFAIRATRKGLDRLKVQYFVYEAIEDDFGRIALFDTIEQINRHRSSLDEFRSFRSQLMEMTEQ